MIGYKLDTFHSPRYTAVQGEALDAIGDALKGRLINFGTAIKLRDFVRSGRVDEGVGNPYQSCQHLRLAATQHSCYLRLS